MYKLQQGVNDFKTWCSQNGERGELLLREWNTDRNSALGYTPDSVARASGKKVWWKCSKCGNVWESAVFNRTSDNHNCPHCAPNACITGTNDLRTWCLQNGERGERLLREWNSEKNSALGFMPESLTKASHTRVWWRCSKCGYQWETEVKGRTNKGNDCPDCAKKYYLTKENTLRTWCLQNGERGELLLQEWDFDKNSVLGYTPDTITRASARRVWWKCSRCGREWETMLCNRTKDKTGCPYCAEEYCKTGENDLRTWCSQNGEYGKQILREWDNDKNSVLGYTPDTITRASGIKVWWRCFKCGCQWEAELKSRTRNNKTGCPDCAKKRCKTGANDLGTWCLQNGEYGKQLLREWNSEKNFALGFTSDTIARGSHKKVWWKCSKCGHEWETTPFRRTSVKSSHHNCLTYGEIIHKGHIKSSCITGTNDFKTWCLQNGERGERLLREWDDVKNLKLGFTPDTVAKGSTVKFWWTCSKCGHEWKATLLYRVTHENNCPYCAMKQCIAGVNDLRTWCLQNGERGERLLQEWDFDKNSALGYTLDNTSRKNNKNVWWKCSRCGYEWEASPNNRTNVKSNGHKCLTYPKRRVCITGENDFKTWCSQNGERGELLLQEWDFDKNSVLGYTPDTITRASHTKVWWKCPKCGHEWKTSPGNRTVNKSGCKQCFQMKHYTNITIINDLRTWCLQNGERGERLLQEWDFDKNLKLGYTPDTIAIASNNRIWWKCSKCGHEWNTILYSRTRNGTNCPSCAGKSKKTKKD